MRKYGLKALIWRGFKVKTTSVIMDLYSRKIVGWAISKNIDAQLNRLHQIGVRLPLPVVSSN